jgi:hypothetical protein
MKKNKKIPDNQITVYQTPDEKINTENLREPLENRLNPLIYKEHEEFNFSPKRPACRQTGEANIYKKCP